MARRAAALMLLGLCLACFPHPALAADAAPGAQARELRHALDLVPYAPPRAVLDALFIADEDAPKGVFGPVAAYAASRACPTAWLIEKGELERVTRLQAQAQAAGSPPFEFSLSLEEDCPGKVSHAVFVVAPGDTPESWLKWRSQFHGRKAEGHYGATLEKLRKARAAGQAPTAELRFLSVNGELLLGSPEARLRAEGRLKPVFDLESGAAAR